MTTPSDIPLQSRPPAGPVEPAKPETLSNKLLVDFSWRNWKSSVVDPDDAESKPVYTIEYHAMSPHLVFRHAANGTDSQFGQGSLHLVSINPDCEVGGRKVKLQALKRLQTEYTFLSRAFANGNSSSNSSGGDTGTGSNSTPDEVLMTWTGDVNLKDWDFVCLDPQQKPVAKFSMHLWAMKKLCHMEFVGDTATTSSAAREELLVTGTTLIYCMVLRTSNVLSLVGAATSSVGPADGQKKKKDL